MSRAVFLDRDGVINATLWNSTEEKWDSPYTLEDFQLLPGTAQAIRSMNELGYLTVVISNQPGVAKGKCSPQFLDALDRKMLLDLAQEDARLDAIYYCLHHPDAQVESLRVACGCRKPKPDLLLRAARDFQIDLESSYFIGDQGVDVEAGLAAGCRTVLVQGSAIPLRGSPGPGGPGTNGQNGQRPKPPLSGQARPHLVAESLLMAVSTLFAEEGHPPDPYARSAGGHSQDREEKRHADIP
ncbi:MAG TPA: HAD family hydrolase [Dehalococcoidia bacterium]|nr:HAD family hydrolase [Dehalococcoidia bacterium]